MNDAETRRMVRMLQTIECLFSENIALKSVLLAKSGILIQGRWNQVLF
jgi:hypothetical protein